ncbi:hypothetical protein [Kangiella shandongensis]|uniref:hypothetical protein n=1 Tax=Kangiella shandongensis TaxID=2763258 RepID=UPI001CBFA498|nr:hypothetical protein [Kangiella shandongensis]
MKRNKQLWLAAAFAGLSATSLSTIASINDSTDLANISKQASAAFQGEVVGIDYKDSVEGIPHTFVTYRIEDDFGSGNAGREVTLRFIGGVKKISEKHYKTLEVSNVPEFVKGSRDIVFLSQKDDGQCPLVQCSNGLFRVKNDQVFDHTGKALAVGKGKQPQPMVEAVGESQSQARKPVRQPKQSMSLKAFKRKVVTLMKGKSAKTLRSADMSQDFHAAAMMAMPAPKLPPRAKKEKTIIEQDVQ